MATANVPVTLGGAVGGYKDIQPFKYSKEKELEGTGDFPAASFPNYLPTWVRSVCARRAPQDNKTAIIP